MSFAEIQRLMHPKSLNL